MSEHWTPDELLALFGSSTKRVEITEDDFARMLDILNGEADDAHTLDEIALESFKGLLASGAYKENPDAAGPVAWTVCVPSFLRGKSLFLAMDQTLMATTAAPGAPGTGGV